MMTVVGMMWNTKTKTTITLMTTAPWQFKYKDKDKKRQTFQVLDGCKARGKLGLIYCGDNERAKACLKQVIICDHRDRDHY